MTLDLTLKLEKKLHAEVIFFHFFFILLLLGTFSRLNAQSSDFSSLNQAEAKRKREAFVNAALDYQGTPYIRGGNSKAGIDCSGLVCKAGTDALGVKLPRTVLSLEQYAEKIPESERERGDLVFFNTTGRISHVGIYLGNGEFVHAASDGPRTGVIISNLSENYWNRTYRFSARILPAVEPERLARPQDESPHERGNTALADIRDNSGSSGAGTAAKTSGNNPEYAGKTFRFDFRGSVLWDFTGGSIPVRGTTVTASAQWVKGVSYFPGVTAGFTWDSRQEIISMPLYISLTSPSGFSLFLGSQLILYSGGEGSKDFFFPGIIGLSWTSKTRKVGPLDIAFYQSMEYVIIPEDNDKSEKLPHGFRLATGLTFMLAK